MDFSPSEVSQRGEKIYFDKLQSKLEKEHKGEFLVIDVVTEGYVHDPDKLQALEKAEKEFGHGFFYILKIGDIQRALARLRKSSYAWTI